MEERDDVISLQDYLVVLKRQRLLIVLVTVLVVSAALGVSFAQTPVYEASAEVIIDPVRRTQDVSLEDLWYQASAIQTERLVITSEPVARRAAEELGLPDAGDALAGVRVEPVQDTRVVRVIASDTDPAAAARRANAVAGAYLDYRRDEAVEDILAARADLEQRAAGLRAELEELEAGGDEIDEIERGAVVSQLSAVVAQIAEVGGGSAGVAGGGSVLAAAEVPSSPVSPRPLRTGALALVLGLLLGVGLAFLRDHIDDVIRDEADFKRATGGLPILGRIPHWEDPEGGERLATVLEPHSLASESYRELSAGVRFLLLAHGDRHGGAGPAVGVGRSIMVSSAHAGDGKTSTAANLAVAAARVGLRTLLIDADLRRPMVHKRFGLGKTTGLTDVLLSGGDVAEHLTTVGIDNLEVLPAGTLPPNPHELLASPAMRALQRDVLLRADLVVYDTPAVLAVPDALELAQYVDVAVLVGRTGSTSRRQLAAAIERMEQVGGEVAGTILNDIDPQTDGYYYSYYYLDEDGKAERSGDAKPKRRPRRAKPSKRQRRGSRRRVDEGSVAAIPAAVPLGSAPAAVGAVTGSGATSSTQAVSAEPAAASAPASPAPDDAASTAVGEQDPHWVRVEPAEASPATTDAAREPEQRASVVQDDLEPAVAAEVAAEADGAEPSGELSGGPEVAAAVEDAAELAVEPEPELVVEPAADADPQPEPEVAVEPEPEPEPELAVEHEAPGEPPADEATPTSVPAEDEAAQALDPDAAANGSAPAARKKPRPRRRSSSPSGKAPEMAPLRTGTGSRRRGRAAQAEETSTEPEPVPVPLSDVSDAGPSVEVEADDDILFGHHRE